MKNSILYLVLLYSFCLQTIHAQVPLGETLLNKSINYHDPKGNWEKWNPSFTLELEIVDRPNRISEVVINNKHNNFYLKVQRDSHLIERIVSNGNCETRLDGKVSTDETQIKQYRLTCERTEMYRDYYTYLYGLPMKLRDKGTIVDQKVEESNLVGKEYWRLKVTYEETVGNDIWYFYFDKNSYALKAYQFYHDEAKNDGEYILLKDEVSIDGIKVPKDRTWYYNNNDELLGTDYLRLEF